MTDSTPRAGAPLIAANQAQKNVTHNEALYQFDALLCARLLDRDLTAPPSSPADGDTYLVKATATGSWTGQDGKIAYCADSAWRFYAPFAGLVAYVMDESDLIVFNGSAWVDYSTLIALENVPLLGVNTTADSTNKLAVKSNAALFTDLPTASGGSGDIRVTLSKQAAANTASFLFQDNFSGRAEIGLTGDDNFHFKVSADGSTWHDALDIAASSGLVTANGCFALAGSSSGTTQIAAQPAASGTLTLPAATDTLVGLATTDTLTNKTLTAPKIATISNTGTLTLPTATDTLVGRATTDTLTNKTLSGGAITGATTLPGSGQITSGGKMLIGGTGGTAIITAQATSNPNISILKTGVIEYLLQIDASNILNIGSAIGTTGIQLNLGGSSYLAPVPDNAYTLGAPSHRWSTVYAGTGTINTSDARDKEWRGALTDAEIAAGKAIIAEIGGFKFLNSITVKGEADARTHIGVRAQNVAAIFTANGLDPAAYGLYCHDSWNATPEIPAVDAVMNAGVVVTPAIPAIPAKPAGDRYGIRADELLYFLMAVLDHRLLALESR